MMIIIVLNNADPNDQRFVSQPVVQQPLSALFSLRPFGSPGLPEDGPIDLLII